IEDHPLVALTDTPRRFTALGVIRVRYGETVALRRLHCPVSAPIAAARLPGRTGQLVPAFACTWPIGPQALDHRDGPRAHPGRQGAADPAWRRWTLPVRRRSCR